MLISNRARSRLRRPPAGVGGGGGGGYDLAGKLTTIRALTGDFNALAEPSPPVDSGNGGTVTNMSQLTDATNTNGGVFTVQPGNYSGMVTLDGLDQKYNFQPGTFQLAAGSGTVIDVTSTARRISLEGLGANPGDAEFLGGFRIANGNQDIKFKNLKIVGYDASSSSIEFLGSLRLLIERCDLRSYVYTLYNKNCVDLICCNSRLEGFVGTPTGQSIARTVAGTRIVVMDNFMRHPTHHTQRTHRSPAVDGAVISDLVYVARNQLESSDFGGGFQLNDSADPGSNPQVNRIWYVDNTFYGGNMAAVSAAGGTTIVDTGNTFPGGGTGPAWAHQ